MNLNRKITNLKGDISRMSYVSRKMVDALPLDKAGDPDRDALPDETVRNVIINCLSAYNIKDRKDILYINTIAPSIISEDETLELKDKLRKFLVEVLYDSINHQNEKTGAVDGIYTAWCISPCLEELGEKVRDDE